MKFKTNVMCNSCIHKITPYMDKLAGEKNWEVDITNPKKILTVKNNEVKYEDVIRALSEAGYKSEKLS